MTSDLLDLIDAPVIPKEKQDIQQDIQQNIQKKKQYIGDTNINETKQEPMFSGKVLTPTSSKYNLYAIVPNSIILYSAKVDHTILPVYLYSWVHQQVHNDNLVDTNIALISETFAPNNKTGLSVRIKDTLKLFGEEVQDYTSPDGSVTPGFSQCVSYRTKFDTIKPTTRLQYYFLDRDIKHKSQFTIITHQEYNYIIDWIDKYNFGSETSIPARESQKRILSSIDIINLYCYLKMRIIQYQNFSKNKLLTTEKQTMHESLDTIAKAMSLGPKTVSKYITLLSTMHMIAINDGKGLLRNKINIYTLSEAWKLASLD